MKCEQCGGSGYVEKPDFKLFDSDACMACPHCDGEGIEPYECDGCKKMRTDVVTVMSSSGETDQCEDCRSVPS
jgi:hypothetical protein